MVEPNQVFVREINSQNDIPEIAEAGLREDGEAINQAGWLNPNDRRWGASFALSLVVHLTVLAGLGSYWLKTVSQMGSDGGEGIESSWSDSESVQETSIRAELSQAVVANDVSQSRTRQSVPVLYQPAAAQANVDLALETDFAVAGSIHDLSVIQGLSDKVTITSIVSRGSASSGDGASQGFFGSQAAGTRFVYVIDSSGSMNHPHPSEAKTRFGVLKLEMMNAIRGTAPDEKFFMIFFNTTALPMPARSLQPGLPKTELRFLRWMSSINADGDTDPSDALMLALRLNPDVIYFLTDGAFKYRVLLDITKANRGRVAIHTFCFGDKTGEKLLRELAQKNRGRYTFIP